MDRTNVCPECVPERSASLWRTRPSVCRPADRLEGQIQSDCLRGIGVDDPTLLSSHRTAAMTGPTSTRLRVICPAQSSFPPLSPDPPIRAERVGVQVRQIVGLRRGPERAYPSVGERGPQKQGREMACLGAKAPVWVGGSGLSFPQCRPADLTRS